jgi:hypothetical protein
MKCFLIAAALLSQLPPPVEDPGGTNAGLDDLRLEHDITIRMLDMTTNPPSLGDPIQVNEITSVPEGIAEITLKVNAWCDHPNHEPDDPMCNQDCFTGKSWVRLMNSDTLAIYHPLSSHWGPPTTLWGPVGCITNGLRFDHNIGAVSFSTQLDPGIYAMTFGTDWFSKFDLPIPEHGDEFPNHFIGLNKTLLVGFPW